MPIAASRPSGRSTRRASASAASRLGALGQVVERAEEEHAVRRLVGEGEMRARRRAAPRRAARRSARRTQPAPARRAPAPARPGEPRSRALRARARGRLRRRRCRARSRGARGAACAGCAARAVVPGARDPATAVRVRRCGCSRQRPLPGCRATGPSGDLRCRESLTQRALASTFEQPTHEKELRMETEEPEVEIHGADTEVGRGSRDPRRGHRSRRGSRDPRRGHGSRVALAQFRRTRYLLFRYANDSGALRRAAVAVSILTGNEVPLDDGDLDALLDVPSATWVDPTTSACAGSRRTDCWSATILRSPSFAAATSTSPRTAGTCTPRCTTR